MDGSPGGVKYRAPYGANNFCDVISENNYQKLIYRHFSDNQQKYWCRKIHQIWSDNYMEIQTKFRNFLQENVS